MPALVVHASMQELEKAEVPQVLPGSCSIGFSLESDTKHLTGLLAGLGNLGCLPQDGRVRVQQSATPLRVSSLKTRM